ncbi:MULTISPECIES: oxygenase MpaB family protein [unclassified Acinetobacter]|uniref:oxygenase MpaB family protein n=1 Tax=unclassified Acinetobacter TaxID=196816 RepID=UPI00244CDB44|nr:MULTISPECIES: oxygenase MpaB family protein [unclassified Acinetobacter]MDH0030868.1 DUF2236 domain-containing protein [Acinetobacter sp. GD04021]MDH0886359.1 DUF2236 domain-containing protein [Acinetobacter sp. GD03873]MDH1082891.1 DUF2236 domain-containing protein [Acinetobacter sp. GD03983]MDH2189917.1 DUF2236 domain-containing protein [Acinetobacter sp. GD03645]MDH2203070.1 DUF2236 domain-containing protein [Acinetobacter sp. GD03647]
MNMLADVPATFSPDAPTSPLPAISRKSWLWSMPLAPWLNLGDELAENVVKTLRAHKKPLAQPLPAIQQLAREGNVACQDFLADMEMIPDWVDFELMAKGGAMAYRHFPQLIIALIHGGLMTTFSNAASAHILSGTQRLEQNVVRRLFESSTLFFGVLDTEALRPYGAVWEICMRVRLMHAMVRLRLMASERWDMATGLPINQLHTAAGPLFFGTMVLESLQALGAKIRPEEHEGYYLIWRYVTRLLGVPLGLLGNTVAEQQAIDQRILPLCFDPNDTSRQLAQALFEGLKNLPDAHMIPKTVHEVLSRYLLGNERADGMGVAQHPIAMRWVTPLAFGLRIYSWTLLIPQVGRSAEKFGKRYLHNLVQRGLAGVAADYQPHGHA